MTGRRCLFVALVVLAGGCAPFSLLDRGAGTEPPPVEAGAERHVPSSIPADGFERALEALEQDEHTLAWLRLRRLVDDCWSGVWGREALLVLASLELNPEYEEGSAQRAAELSARYLLSPDVPPASSLLAETLYLLALDLGAEPVHAPHEPRGESSSLSAENRGAADTFRITRSSTCQGGAATGPLPEHPGPRTTRGELERARAQRDSLARRLDAATRRNQELESEIERIRGLLLPDSLGREPVRATGGGS